jgi:hypothetical protein
MFFRKETKPTESDPQAPPFNKATNKNLLVFGLIALLMIVIINLIKSWL